MILHEGLKNTYYLEKLIEKEDLQLNKHESQIWTKIQCSWFKDHKIDQNIKNTKS